MRFLQLKDATGAERHVNFEHVSDVRFEHRNRGLREEVTIVFASGGTAVFPKEYADAIRAAMYPDGAVCLAVAKEDPK